jgi:hypothetical protein
MSGLGILDDGGVYVFSVSLAQEIISGSVLVVWSVVGVQYGGWYLNSNGEVWKCPY